MKLRGADKVLAGNQDVDEILGLRGKAVLVTGAASGLGAATARAFAEVGARVVLADISPALDAQVARLSDEGYDVSAAVLDVSSEADWRAVADQVRARHGRLDVLVNNAGIIVRGGLATPLDRWNQVLAVNVTGAFLGMRTMAPLMPDGGDSAIVNVSSTAGLIAHTDASYTTSKWALRGLTKAASLELVARGIRVNSVHPATIATALTDAAPPGHLEANRHAIPMGREASPQEVARTIVFLASRQASFMTGAELAVDGGLSTSGVAWMRRAFQQAWTS
ncbi:SDR family NAD(P)-dependent oxidoreductase [Bordetella genomosp. 8]|uniref:SDR family NAD(P)-dependent oxidoreductase n=1 Tax=Bordetella genomosp. 8 TaxID=1416806 RepID=UPI0018DF1163|nr:SDR family oxidoreductase [Bordetella genomosp. 8]